MTMINYNAPAALYLGSNAADARAQGARTFSTAAKAIRFAVEEAAPVSLHGARLIVDGRTFGPRDLRKLYRSETFPLMRKRTRQSLLESECEPA